MLLCSCTAARLYYSTTPPLHHSTTLPLYPDTPSPLSRARTGSCSRRCRTFRYPSRWTLCARHYTAILHTTLYTTIPPYLCTVLLYCYTTILLYSTPEQIGTAHSKTTKHTHARTHARTHTRSTHAVALTQTQTLTISTTQTHRIHTLTRTHANAHTPTRSHAHTHTRTHTHAPSIGAARLLRPLANTPRAPPSRGDAPRDRSIQRPARALAGRYEYTARLLD